jgi:hypothetical protein
MRNNKYSRNEQDGIEPDHQLGRLLSAAYPEREILAWDKVEALVANAPGLRPTFSNRWQHWLSTGPAAQRQTFKPALALFSLLLVMACGALYATPAMSYRVGTIVTTKKPASWNASGVELKEIREAAQAKFADRAVADSELYLMVLPRSGRDDLAFTMLGVSEAEAREFFSEFSSAYPALGAFEAEYTSVESEDYPNLLYQAVSSLTQRRASEQRDPAKLRTEMLSSLREQGFENINVDVTTKSDGTVLISIDATMEIEVSGHSQEELEAVGISPELVGGEAYTELVSELGLR